MSDVVHGRSTRSFAASRAITRWSWRLLRREWRQQVLILALIVVAVGAMVVGAGVAYNTPLPANEGFGSARDQATFQGSAASIARDVTALRHAVGSVGVIENDAIHVPGSINTYSLRAEDVHGPYVGPLIQLVRGHYPATATQTAITAGVASELRLQIGSTLVSAGRRWTVVGIVQNPESLLDEFALVLPGQVARPTVVTVLFDATADQLNTLPASVYNQVVTLASVESNQSNFINPQTVVLAVSMLGLLLIALVAIGGFTVLAQRRLRAIGLLASVGATSRQVRAAVRTNGLAVGLLGTLLGAILGFGVWLGYRPTLEQSAHHYFSATRLPWTIVVIGMVVAVVATYLAASRPAQSVVRVPIVTALAGRPPDPAPVHRSAVPGLIFGGAGVLLVGAASAARGSGGALPLLVGLLFLTVAIILLSPFLLTLVDRVFRRAPFAVRFAARNLSRYRARSGATLSAIALSVMIAVIVCVVAAARYGNVLDYVGPNVSSNQIIVYTNIVQPGTINYQIGPNGNPVETKPKPTSAAEVRKQVAAGTHLGATLGARADVALYAVDANIDHDAAGRNFTGPLYLATPSLLAAFHITPSMYSADADVLTMRPGLDQVGNLVLNVGNGGGPGPSGPPCPPSSCDDHLVIDEVGNLPSGTSAPNTVITEHAATTLHIQSVIAGWLLVFPHALSASQIESARSIAAASNLSIETKSSAPTASEINGWATTIGTLLALAILLMSLGLLRAETASDLRTFAAAGATGYTRRLLAATTAGSLALIGALTGMVVGYLTVIAFLNGSPNGDSVSELSNVPARDLLILAVAFPLVAFAIGWVTSARAPRQLAQRPLE